MPQDVPVSGETLSAAKHLELHQIITADTAGVQESLNVDANQNVGVGTSTFGTDAAKVIGIASGTAPTTSPADMVQMWTQDRAGAAGKAGLCIRTETGAQHFFGDYCGIGTLTPGAYALQINDPSGASIVDVRGSTYGLVQFKDTSAGGAAQIGVQGVNRNDLSIYTAQYMAWFTQDNAIGLGANTDPDQFVHVNQTETITGAVTDGYAGALLLDPGYSAASALAVTRHNYIDVRDVSVGGAGPASVTDSCVLRFDAALGTHKATTNADKTGNAKSGTIKVNVNGTIYHIQLYAA